MKYVASRDGENVLVPGHYFLFNWIRPYILNKAVLDIGCWSGPLEELMIKEKCNVTGIDIESAPLKTATKKFPKFKFYKHSIVDALPKKEEFDVVLYFMVIEHIPRGSELVSLININRSMKKNGTLFINTMNNNLLSNVLDPAFFFGHRHYSKKELLSLLQLSGFTVKDIKYNAGFYTTLSILILYFFKHALGKKEPRNRLIDALVRRDYRNKGFAEIDIRAVKTASI
jgi:SAM-dependent methyltransferase